MVRVMTSSRCCAGYLLVGECEVVPTSEFGFNSEETFSLPTVLIHHSLFRVQYLHSYGRILMTRSEVSAFQRSRQIANFLKQLQRSSRLDFHCDHIRNLQAFNCLRPLRYIACRRNFHEFHWVEDCTGVVLVQEKLFSQVFCVVVRGRLDVLAEDLQENRTSDHCFHGYKCCGHYGKALGLSVSDIYC